MKHFLHRIGVGMCALLILAGCEGMPRVPLNPQDPVNITIWHYYSGSQQIAFSKLVQEFNDEEGAKRGIYVEEFSQGSVEDLENGVLAAAEKRVGAAEMPNIFAAYADTAYTVDKLDKLVDVNPYFTQEELDQYVNGYLKEGYFAQDGSLKILPIAKSTEILLLNLTDWETFEQETGATLQQLSTIEGVTKTAKQYYAWTDAKTPEIANDGKAFFGRDAFANYMLIGSRQLGVEMFQVKDGVCRLHFNKRVLRKLWDNYYVPMVAGWFAEENRFRSDDIKMGTILACIASSTSATFFPEQCTLTDQESYPIKMKVLQAPKFMQGMDYAVQQGAGMVVTKASKQEVEASVIFLKWFTQSMHDTDFSIGSGYMPVTKQASQKEYLMDAIAQNSVEEKVADVLTVAATTVNENTMYTPRVFDASSEARILLEEEMPKQAKQDRKAFLELLSQGMPYEKALQTFTGQKKFNMWYIETLQKLAATVKRADE